MTGSTSGKRGLSLVLAAAFLSLLFALDIRASGTSVRAVDDEPITFAIIGDYGRAGSDELAVALLVASWSPAFVLTTGDNNYPTGAAATIDQNIGQYYHDFIAPYSGAFGSGAAENRFFPALGNHDWETAGAAPYLAYFTLPGNERYYDLVRGPLHFFAVDSDPREPDGTSSGSTQGHWLRDRLVASTACWRLVYFHHAPYSSGLHGSSVGMRWPFREWGASVVVAGHDHTYERLLIDGLPYFVNGLGGYSRYQFNTPVAGSVARYNAGFGAMRVTASRTAITYEFITTTGTVVDAFTQTGGCGAAVPTLTPTTTPTPTPPPTPTPTPSPCAPRPPIRVRTARGGPGELLVTVSRTDRGSPLSALRFGEARNALIYVPGQSPGATGNFDVPLPPAVSNYTFTVWREIAGRDVYVPFIVVDSCGDWPTFVGGGPTSF